MIQITNVTIFPINNSKVAAFASIVIDNSFVVYDLKILKSVSGLIVCLPDKRMRYRCQHCERKCDFDSAYCKYCGLGFRIVDSDRSYVDVCHPINHQCRAHIDKAVIEAYLKYQKEHQETQESKPVV